MYTDRLSNCKTEHCSVKTIEYILDANLFAIGIVYFYQKNAPGPRKLLWTRRRIG